MLMPSLRSPRALAPNDEITGPRTGQAKALPDRAGGSGIAARRCGGAGVAGSGPWVDLPIALARADMLNVIGDGSGNAGLVHVTNLVEAFVLAAASCPIRP